MKTIIEFIEEINEVAKSKEPNKDPNFNYSPFRTPHSMKTTAGHELVGHTSFGPGHKYPGGKGANILKHINSGPNAGKYFAAGGSTNRIISSTTFHNSPEEAAKDYHK